MYAILLTDIVDDKVDNDLDIVHFQNLLYLHPHSHTPYFPENVHRRSWCIGVTLKLKVHGILVGVSLRLLSVFTFESMLFLSKLYELYHAFTRSRYLFDS